MLKSSGSAQSRTASVMSPQEEASKLLEAALLEMDGIIAGAGRSDFDDPGPPPSPILSISEAVERLKLAIQQQYVMCDNGNDETDDQMSDSELEERNNNHSHDSRRAMIDPDTQQLILRWLTSNGKQTTGVNGMELEARVQKLEGDKNALQFQVSLLQDQIQNQQHKILDLERALETKRAQLAETEEALKRELNQRSSLEAHKLDLMTEIGNLHLRQSKLERENLDLREQLRAAEITSLEYSVLPRGRSGKPGSGSNDVDSSYVMTFDNMSLDAGKNRPPSGNSMRVPTSTSSAASNATKVYKADQYHFLSLPRPGKDSGSKTTDDIELLLRGNSAVRPPSGHQQRVTATATVSNSDWPPKNLPVKRPTTPTLDRTRERIVHSCSPSPSFGNADGNGAKSRQRGIRNIFSKMKKSSSAATGNSGSSHDDGENSSDSSFAPKNEFQRGGVRATAGGRLGWSPAGRGSVEPLKSLVPEKPSKWASEQICTWLGELGLGSYAPAARSFLQSGEAMLALTPGDLEKHLGVRNALHRKKILLSRDRLRRLEAGNKDALGEDVGTIMDNAGVLRWLADVGLAQYRDTFTECRVDGAVLDKITVEEATQWLKVTNFMHFLGLRSGIRVLREVRFDLTQLSRTVYEDGDTEQSAPHQSSQATNVKSLARWTNSRIIEWLRCIDLAEFADNLKGSGVHGGVFVYEDRFNSETLASVLEIPTNKSLLRRHLSLQFASLVGKNVLQAKREAEASRHHSSGTPLSPSTKIKVYKSQFGLIKKKCKFGEFEPNDFVCPPTVENGESGDKASSARVTKVDLPETAID